MAVKYIGVRPVGIDNIVISAQHDENITLDILRDSTLTEVIEAVIPQELLKDETKFYINPTGRFVIGGPQADAGLSGRKIIMDSYGGIVHMVEAHSLVKTQQRWIEVVHIWLDI